MQALISIAVLCIGCMTQRGTLVKSKIIINKYHYVINKTITVGMLCTTIPQLEVLIRFVCQVGVKHVEDRMVH